MLWATLKKHVYRCPIYLTARTSDRLIVFAHLGNISQNQSVNARTKCTYSYLRRRKCTSDATRTMALRTDSPVRSCRSTFSYCTLFVSSRSITARQGCDKGSRYTLRGIAEFSGVRSYGGCNDSPSGSKGVATYIYTRRGAGHAPEHDNGNTRSRDPPINEISDSTAGETVRP